MTKALLDSRSPYAAVGGVVPDPSGADDLRGYSLDRPHELGSAFMKGRLEFRFRFARYRIQETTRELSPNHRSDLRHFFSLTEPIEPRHHIAGCRPFALQCPV